MGFSHWWFSLLVSDEVFSRLDPGFRQAETQADLSSYEVQVLSEVLDPALNGSNPKAEPSHHLQGWYNTFAWTFNRAGFDTFAAEFCTRDGLFNAYLSEETVFRFISADRCPPCAALWYALGYERASLLPGAMGNLLCSSKDVSGAQEAVHAAYADCIPEELIERGWLLLRNGNNQINEMKKIITMLPEGLARARASKKGFLSLARAQI
jgi:hypothetical protein